MLAQSRRHRISLPFPSLWTGWHIPAAALLVIGSIFGLAPVAANAAGSYQLLGQGLDSCTAPSTAQMANFWVGTPYYSWGIYIGGNQRACAQPNLTSSWIGTVTNGSANGISMAWKLLPIWVGPQNPCQPGFGSYISLNTATAYSQGQNEAASAYNAWVGGLGQSTDTPIEYDMEATGGTNTSGCLAAVQSFINGWVVMLHGQPAQKAGVYTSTCGGNIAQFATIAHPPDFIDGAAYGSGTSTSSMPCVPTSYWASQQRHKQYAGPHNETWNGTTINVDSRCSNSWTYATYQSQNTSQGCG